MAKFNGVVITQDSIQKCRQWFADNAQGCINQAKSGEIYVNDLFQYTERQEALTDEYLDGAWDHTFAFLQRAHYIQTGECVALLP